MGTLHRPGDTITRHTIVSQIAGTLGLSATDSEILYDQVILPLLEREYRRGAIGWQREAARHLDEHEKKEHERHGLRHALARHRYHATIDADWLRMNANRMENDDIDPDAR